MTPKQQDELLPCPFCAGKPCVWSQFKMFVVECSQCLAKAKYHYAKDDAITAWNMRSAGVEAQGDVAKDAERLDKLEAAVAGGKRVEFATSLFGSGVEIGVRHPIFAAIKPSIREAIDAAITTDAEAKL